MVEGRTTILNQAFPMSPVMRIVLSGMLALALAMGIGRFLYTPLLPLMQDAEGFGPDIAGLIGSANFAGYLAGSLLMSLVTREPLRRRVFRLGLIASVTTTAAMGLTDNLIAWVVIRTISGVASATCMILASWYVFEAVNAAGEVRKAGWLWGGVGLGIAISGLMTRAGSGVLAWDALWLTGGAICLTMLPVIWREIGPWTMPPVAAPVVAGRRPRPYPFTPLMLAYVCEGLGYSVFATFIVAILKSRPGLEVVADYAWVIAGLAGLPSALALAWLAGRIGFAAALVVAYLAQMVGVALPALSDGATAAIMAALLFGGTFTGISLLALQLGKSGGGGRGIALLTAGFSVGQIVAPAAAGYLAARGGGFESSLLGSAAILGLGALLLVYGIARRNRVPSPS
jgi:MFS family permease